MTDIALIIVILALLAYIGVNNYFDRKERKTTMKALMAKNLQEFVTSEVIEKQEPEPKEEESEMVPLNEADDATWLMAMGLNENLEPVQKEEANG